MISRTTFVALCLTTPITLASEQSAAPQLHARVRLAEFRELVGSPVELDEAAPARKPDEPFANARPDGRFLALAGGITEFGVECRLDPRLLDQAARAGLDGRPGTFVHGFIGFDRRQTASRLAQLESLGVRFLGTFPPNAQLAALPIERLPEIAGLPGVAFVGAAKPEHKMHPELLRRLTPSSGEFEAFLCAFDDDRTEQMVTERIGGGSARRGEEIGEVIVPEEMGRMIRSTGGWQERVLRQLGIESSTYLPAPRAFRVKLDVGSCDPSSIRILRGHADTSGVALRRFGSRSDSRISAA